MADVPVRSRAGAGAFALTEGPGSACAWAGIRHPSRAAQGPSAASNRITGESTPEWGTLPTPADHRRQTGQTPMTTRRRFASLLRSLTSLASTGLLKACGEKTRPAAQTPSPAPAAARPAPAARVLTLIQRLGSALNVNVHLDVHGRANATGTGVRRSGAHAVAGRCARAEHGATARQAAARPVAVAAAAADGDPVHRGEAQLGPTRPGI
jgi:hypothetical protein